MQFFRRTPNFDFLGKRKVAMLLSAALLIISVYSLGTSGLNLGLDFRGGILLEVGYPQAVGAETCLLYTSPSPRD